MGLAGFVRLLLAVIAAVAVVTTTGAPVAAAQGDARRVPDSIDATGTEDVTDALQAFVDEVRNRSVIEFPTGARYRVEGTLRFTGRRGLTVEGNGATILATTEADRERSHVAIVGGSRIVIRDLVVKGAHPAGGVGDNAYRAELEAQHGFNILGARDVELDTVTVTDVFGDFVYIGAFGRDADKRGSKNVWVHDSTFSRNGRQGLAITAGENVVFEHNQIGETRRATVDLEPNSPRFGAKNVHILENIVGEGRLLFLASHGNGPVDDIVISRNQLPGHPLTMSVRAAGDRRARWWVTDNVARRTERTPMSFQRVDGVVVRNNTEPVTREGASGVGLRDVCGANVSGNNFLPAIQESSASGEPCEFEISAVPPEPPSIRGRDEDGSTVAGPTAAGPASSAPAGTTSSSTPAASSDDGGGGGESSTIVLIVGVLALVVGVGAATTAAVSARNRARARRYRSYDG